MSLLTVYFLIAVGFGPTGDPIEVNSIPFRTEAECIARRTAIIEEPPAGIPEGVALVCAPVQFRVRNT